MLKILDFGLAKVAAPERPALESATTETKGLQTQAGTVMGTLGYMSPEQVRGEVVDRRTDVFALGVILYEMVAGTRPFLGQSSADTISAILTQDPPSLAERAGEAPAGLDGVVRRCLSKRREERFSEAGDVALALEALSEPGAVAADGKPRRGSIRKLAGAAVLVVVAAVLGLWWWSRNPTPAGRRGVRSLAVLPLENLSGDPTLDYFADGMTEALIADLSRIDALRVVSRTSVLRYKGSPLSAPKIAAELGVDALVEGSVLHSGGRVRITAQLIDGSTDEHLWAESYTRDMKDVLSLQSEVARRIAGEVDASLTPAEETRLAHQREVDPEAYDAYLRGDYRLYAGTSTSADAIVGSLRRAIELDPEFAPAYARLADFYGFTTMLGYTEPAEAYLEARRFASKAVELDPGLPEAHASLARILFQYEWDWPGAEREFERALELSPNDVPTLGLYGAYLVLIRGRCDEGLAALQRAVDRDPFNFSYVFDLGLHSFHCRRFDDSLRHLERSLELRPGMTFTQRVVAWNYSAKGWHEEALALTREMLARPGDAFDASLLTTAGAVNAWAGREDEARRFLEELRNPPEGLAVDPTWIAFVCAALRDDECALSGLEEAHRQRSSNIVFMRVALAWDPLRDHPRFRALLERMDFPP